MDGWMDDGWMDDGMGQCGSRCEWKEGLSPDRLGG
jgi:hypothetical protein